MGSGSFQRQNCLFRRFWGNSGIFGVVGGSWCKRQGLLRILEIFVKFWRVYSGLGPICKYFSETEGPAQIFTNVQGLRRNLQNFSSTRKLIDQVHGAVDQRRGQVHGGPAGSEDTGHGGPSLPHCAHVLEVAGAHLRWPRRMSKMRR
jgi:hypothetical protein